MSLTDIDPRDHFREAFRTESIASNFMERVGRVRYLEEYARPDAAAQ